MARLLWKTEMKGRRDVWVESGHVDCLSSSRLGRQCRPWVNIQPTGSLTLTSRRIRRGFVTVFLYTPQPLAASAQLEWLHWQPDFCSTKNAWRPFQSNQPLPERRYGAVEAALK